MIVIYISLAFLSRAKDSQQYVRWCADIHIFLFLRTGRPPHYYNSYSSCSQAMPTRSNNCSTASGRRPAVASIRKIRSQSSKSKLHRLIAATDLNTLAACCTSAFVCTPVLNINISVTINQSLCCVSPSSVFLSGSSAIPPQQWDLERIYARTRALPSSSI